MENNPYESPHSVKPGEPQPNNESRLDVPELFGVAVRAIGLYFIATGIVYAIGAIFLLRGFPRIQDFDVWWYARGAVEYLTPGIICFFFAKRIVQLTYRDASEPPFGDS